MGLFSKLRKPATSGNLALARAVLVPSAMVMISDGSVDDSELKQLGNLCGFSPIFADIPPETTFGILKQINQEFGTLGFQTVLERAIAELSMPMRETALLFAMRVAMADGHLDENEKKSLLVLCQKLGVSDTKFIVMFDVVAILQRHPQAA